MTPEGDIDLNTLVEGEDMRVLAAAVVVALQTFIGEWRGNLKLGLDRALFLLRDADDIRAGLRDGCRRALAGLPLRIETLEVIEIDARTWGVQVKATATETGQPLNLTVELL